MSKKIETNHLHQSVNVRPQLPPTPRQLHEHILSITWFEYRQTYDKTTHTDTY